MTSTLRSTETEEHVGADGPEPARAPRAGIPTGTRGSERVRDEGSGPPGSRGSGRRLEDSSTGWIAAGPDSVAGELGSSTDRTRSSDMQNRSRIELKCDRMLSSSVEQCA